MDSMHPKVLGEFWISVNTPSSKNGRMIVEGKLIQSKHTYNWKKLTRLEWGSRHVYWNKIKNYMFGGGQAMLFQYDVSTLTPPYYVEFTFHRESKRRFDLINMTQALMDEMVKNNWIPDDDSTYIVPYYGDPKYTKEKPGVEIKLLSHKPTHYGS